MNTEEREEKARNLRTVALVLWDRGEIEASEVLRYRAIRMERELRKEFAS